MYPVLRYVEIPTLFELAGRLCAVLLRTRNAATTLPSLLFPPAIRETLWMFITIAIRLGPFGAAKSPLVDVAHFLRAASDALCSPTLLAIADYRGTQYMSRLPPGVCLAPMTLDWVVLAAKTLSALVEVPTLLDIVLTTVALPDFASTLDFVLSSAIMHYAKRKFGIYDLQACRDERMAAAHALAQQVADARSSLLSAKEQLSRAQEHTALVEQWSKDYTQAKAACHAALEHAQHMHRTVADTQAVAKIWRARVVDVIEDAKRELETVTARAADARVQRAATLSAAKHQLGRLKQAIRTVTTTTHSRQADYLARLHSFRALFDDPSVHRMHDPYSLQALLMVAGDSHQQDANSLSENGARLAELDSKLSAATDEHAKLSEDLEDSDAKYRHHMQGCDRTALVAAVQAAKAHREAASADFEKQEAQWREDEARDIKEQDAWSHRFVMAHDARKAAEKKLDALRLRVEQRRAAFHARFGDVDAQLARAQETLKTTHRETQQARAATHTWQEKIEAARKAHDAEIVVSKATIDALRETGQQLASEIAALQRAKTAQEQQHAQNMEAAQRTHDARIEQLTAEHKCNAERQLLGPARAALRSEENAYANGILADIAKTKAFIPKLQATLLRVQEKEAAEQRKNTDERDAFMKALVKENSQFDTLCEAGRARELFWRERTGRLSRDIAALISELDGDLDGPFKQSEDLDTIPDTPEFVQGSSRDGSPAPSTP